MCRLSGSLGTSASWNPHGLSRPVQGLLYLLLKLYIDPVKFTVKTIFTKIKVFHTHVPRISYIKMYSLPVIIRVIKIKTNDMIEACDRYGGGDRCMQSFDGEV